MKENKKKITRELIIEAAILIADEKGINNLTLKDIAEYLGIKTPSLYNHIGGLEELNDLLAHAGLEKMLASLTDAVVGRSGKEAILSLASAYRQFALDYPGYYQAAQLVPLWKKPSTKELSDAIVALLIRVISIYNFTEEENIHVVRTLRSYLHGITLLEMQKSFDLLTEVNDSLTIGLNAILDGFGIK